jgi:hypothetical protein
MKMALLLVLLNGAAEKHWLNFHIGKVGADCFGYYQQYSPKGFGKK